MRQINITQARRHLSRLVDEAGAGDRFIIAKAGKPVAMVVPIEAPKAKSRLGFLVGQIAVPSDFDIIGDEEMASLFEGDA